MLKALTIVLVSIAVVLPARGGVVDVDSSPARPLDELVESLDATGVDVLYSHDSEAARVGPSFGDRPRLAPLIGFKAWSTDGLDLERHAEWLNAFGSGARGAIAAAPADGGETRPDREAFERIWSNTVEGERVVITFDAADLAVAERVADTLEENGYAVYLAIATPELESLAPAVLGRLFVEADHVLMLDTATARMNDIIQFEADLLAELRRIDAWVESDDDGLPPIKRGPLDVVEALGALPMQVMPGGIVLGMKPTLDAELEGATFGFHGSDFGIKVDGDLIVIEQVSAETREAILGLIAIEGSHSVVDLAGGETTLADPMKNTRVGSRMIHADELPFHHLSVNGAGKSLIVDDAIIVRPHDGRIAVDVSLQVRFYRPDDEDHAVRVATIGFTVQDVMGSSRMLDMSWAREPDTKVRFDGCSIENMMDGLEPCAIDAALIAIARLEAADADG